MDWAKLKEGLKLVMEISSDCNKFVTDNEFFAQSVPIDRKRVIVSILTNAIRILACL